MNKAELINNMKKRMDGAINTLDHDLKGLRAGRASPNLLDPVVVEAYGDKLHITGVATISVPEARMLSVQVWDKALVKAVEKAIANADLGLNPSSDGNVIRVPIPALSEERRKEMVKIAGKYAEQAKVAIRNVRRDELDVLKKMEKDSQISKDEHHNISDEIQKITDDYVKKVDSLLQNKEKEIMHV